MKIKTNLRYDLDLISFAIIDSEYVYEKPVSNLEKEYKLQPDYREEDFEKRYTLLFRCAYDFIAYTTDDLEKAEIFLKDALDTELSHKNYMMYDVIDMPISNIYVYAPYSRVMRQPESENYKDCEDTMRDLRLTDKQYKYTCILEDEIYYFDSHSEMQVFVDKTLLRQNFTMSNTFRYNDLVFTYSNDGESYSVIDMKDPGIAKLETENVEDLINAICINKYDSALKMIIHITMNSLFKDSMEPDELYDVKVSSIIDLLNREM